MELQDKMHENKVWDKIVHDIEKEVQDSLSGLTVEAFKKMGPADQLKLLNGIQTQVGMLRRKMAQQEQERLSLTYNKLPKDVELLTKNETQLRHELIMSIDQG